MQENEINLKIGLISRGIVMAAQKWVFMTLGLLKKPLLGRFHAREAKSNNFKI